MDTNPSGQQRTHDSVSIAMYIMAGGGLLVLSLVLTGAQPRDVPDVLVFILSLLYVAGGALLAVGCIAAGIVVARR